MRHLLFTLALFGCTDGPDELWIDRRCPVDVKVAIRQVVGEVNDMCGEELIKIAGETTGRGQVGTDAQSNNATDIAACVTEPEVPRKPGILGFGAYSGDVWLWTDVVPDDWTLAVLRHEIGHYAGARHIDDPDAVMYRSMSSDRIRDGYTDADRDEICR